MSGDAVFYGVAAGSDAGHFFYVPSAPRRVARAHGRDLPLPAELARPEWVDGRWCFPVPKIGDRRELDARSDGQAQGRGFVHSAHGWTVISWWDRSGDDRMGSNAVFVVRGFRRWAEALRLAREAFPLEMARMEAAYSIELAGADLPDPGDDPAAAAEAAATQEADRLRALHPDVLAALRRVMGRP